MRQAIDGLTSDKPIKDLQEVDSVVIGIKLPDGRFGETAVAVANSEPDVYYPEIKKDGLEVKAVMAGILGILKLYDKSIQ